MAGFMRGGAILDTSDIALSGVSGIELFTINGKQYLLATSMAEQGYSLFERLDRGLVWRDSFWLEEIGEQALTYDLAPIGEGTGIFLPLSNYDRGLELFTLSGGRIAPLSFTGNAPNMDRMRTAASLEIDGKSFVYWAAWSTSGISSFRFHEGGVKTKKAYADTADTFLGSVSDLEAFSYQGFNFLVSISEFDAGLTTYRIGRHGNLHQKDQMPPSEATGFHLPQDVEMIEHAGRAYLVMASAGTDSLTVYRMNKHGKLKETDALHDTLHTRFEEAAHLADFSYEGRSFLLAAGNDHGITLFELSAEGKLIWRHTLEDDFDTTLWNITDLAVDVSGDQITVYASSATEHGITWFTLDLGDLGPMLEGSRGKDVLTGTAQDDVLYGYGGGDQISGNAGDDTLIGGKGKDIFTGGPGADVFVLIPDGRRDQIKDFEQGKDKIDLSSFGIGHYKDILIKQRPYGANLLIDEEVIRVESHNGAPYTLADWGADDFLF